MKKLLIIFALVSLSVSSLLAVGFDNKGTPEIYKMNFVEFAMRNTAGEWVIIKDTDSIVDLASANPGELAKAISGGSVPAGSYDMFRSTVSMHITMKGAVKVGTDLYYTTANTEAVAGPNPGDEPGQGCIPGTYDLTSAEAITEGIIDAVTFYAAIKAGDIVVADYAACTIKPPTVADEHEVTGADAVAVKDGDIVDTEMEADVADGLHLLTTGMGPPHLFPAPISIMVN